MSLGWKPTENLDGMATAIPGLSGSASSGTCRPAGVGFYWGNAGYNDVAPPVLGGFGIQQTKDWALRTFHCAPNSVRKGSESRDTTAANSRSWRCSLHLHGGRQC